MRIAVIMLHHLLQRDNQIDVDLFGRRHAGDIRTYYQI